MKCIVQTLAPKTVAAPASQMLIMRVPHARLLSGSSLHLAGRAPIMTAASARRRSRDALLQLNPLWDELFPAEQARIVQLLVERCEIAEDGLDIRFRTDGFAGRVHELSGTCAWVGFVVVRQQKTVGRRASFASVDAGPPRRVRHSAARMLAVLRTFGAWLRGLFERAHPNVVVVALAAKLARIAWVVLRSRADYDWRATRA